MKFETTVPYTTPKRGPAAAVRGEGRPALQSWGRGEAAGVLPATHCGSHCESECSPVSASLFPLYSWGGGVETTASVGPGLSPSHGSPKRLATQKQYR